MEWMMDFSSHSNKDRFAYYCWKASWNDKVSLQIYMCCWKGKNWWGMGDVYHVHKGKKNVNLAKSNLCACLTSSCQIQVWQWIRRGKRRRGKAFSSQPYAFPCLRWHRSSQLCWRLTTAVSSWTCWRVTPILSSHSGKLLGFKSSICGLLVVFCCLFGLFGFFVFLIFLYIFFF